MKVFRETEASQTVLHVEVEKFNDRFAENDKLKTIWPR